MQAKIILVLIIVVIALGGSLAVMKIGLDIAHEERDQAIEFKLDARDSVKLFTNLWGRESAKVKVQDLTINNLKRLQTDKDLAWIKQFASVNKRMNNVEQASRTTAVATGEFKMTLMSDSGIPLEFSESSHQWTVDDETSVWAENDSTYLLLSGNIINLSRKPIDTRALCPTRTFDNHNEWFRIQGKVTADTIVVTPMVPIVMESVITWKRKHKFLFIRFGKKEYTAETTSPNPYIHFTSHKVTRVGRKK